MVDGKKIYIFYCDRFKYEGYIVGETETHFIVNDFKDGEILLPKAGTTLKEAEK